MKTKGNFHHTIKKLLEFGGLGSESEWAVRVAGGRVWTGGCVRVGGGCGQAVVKSGLAVVKCGGCGPAVVGGGVRGLAGVDWR